MSEEEKWKLINQTISLDELADAVLKIAENGMIQGRSKSWDAKKHAEYCRNFIGFRRTFPNVLTRNYGIRQQAIYLCN